MSNSLIVSLLKKFEIKRLWNAFIVFISKLIVMVTETDML